MLLAIVILWAVASLSLLIGLAVLARVELPELRQREQTDEPMGIPSDSDPGCEPAEADEPSRPAEQLR